MPASAVPLAASSDLGPAFAGPSIWAWAGVILFMLLASALAVSIRRRLMAPKALDKGAPRWIWWRSKILPVGITGLVLVLFFPPWHFWLHAGAHRRTVPGGRSFIFDPPAATAESCRLDPGQSAESYSVGIDFHRLAIESVAVASLTGLLLLMRARTLRL